MKILFYTDNFLPGGGNRYFIDLINAASSTYEDISILTNKGGLFEEDLQRLKKEIKITEINRVSRESFAETLFGQTKLANYLRIFGLVLKPFFFIINYYKFKRLLKRDKPNLVISSNGGYPAAESSIALVFASHILGIKSMLTIVSMPASRRWYLYLYDVILDKLLSKTDIKLVVNSDAQINALKEIRGLTNDIYCVYNGLEDYEHNNSTISNITQSPILFGTICRLDKGKGLDYLLKAINILKGRKMSNIKFLLFGKGAEYHNLSNLISKFQIEEYVDLKGYFEGQVYEQLEKFDVFVFPSLWEGLPYSLVEAQRSGLPIISTNVGGIPEVVRHMEEGLLLEPQNETALANNIEFLANSEQLRAEMSRKARLRYENLFTLKVMEKDFLKLLSE